MSDIFQGTKCAKCGNPLCGETETIDGKPVCDDCYFEEFGEELDKNPIGMPRLKFRLPPEISIGIP
jgi:hypothetical protein